MLGYIIYPSGTTVTDEKDSRVVFCPLSGNFAKFPDDCPTQERLRYVQSTMKVVDSNKVPKALCPTEDEAVEYIREKKGSESDESKKRRYLDG